MGGKAHLTRGDLKDAPDTKGTGSHYSGGTQVPWGSERDGDCAWGDGVSAWRLVETGGQKSRSPVGLRRGCAKGGVSKRTYP